MHNFCVTNAGWGGPPKFEVIRIQTCVCRLLCVFSCPAWPSREIFKSLFSSEKLVQPLLIFLMHMCVTARY